MHVQPSLRKALRRTRRYVAKGAKCKQSRHPYLDAGCWRIEDDDNGDLIVRNFETMQHVILIRREEGDS